MKVKVYEWLTKDTSQPYLRVDYQRNHNTEIDATFKVADNQTTEYPHFYGISRIDRVSSKVPGLWSAFMNSNKTLIYKYQGNDFRPNFTLTADKEYRLIDKDDSIEIDGNVFQLPTARDYGNCPQFGIFRPIEYIDATAQASGGANESIKRFVITENGQVILHLVPCLTEQGEACMLDLISGELYRNQGSGAFSVEGECLYEFETPVIKQVMRKPNVIVRMREWLKSDGNSWIKIADSITLSKQTKISALVRDYVYSTDIMGAYENINKCFGFAFVTFSRLDYGVLGVLRNDDIKADKFLYEVNNGIAKINDVQKTLADYNDTINSPLYLFCRQTNAYRYSGAIGEVKINTEGINLDLRPCDILLHPTLPPQSAMIDPNTGTIYTNQGTGQFSCEGEDLGIWTDTMFDDMRIKDVKADMVCVMQNGEPWVVWERTPPFVKYKWLKGSSKNLQFSVNVNESIEIQPKVPTDNGYNIFYKDSHSIWSARHAGYPYAVSSSGNRYFAETDCYAKRYPNPKISVDIDTQEITLEGFKEKWYGGAGIYIFEILDGYKAITIDGHILSPCQLTRDLFPHEIASSNTALRGECGFADKERYKRGEPWFFGNRATSGSFGVSDE